MPVNPIVKVAKELEMTEKQVSSVAQLLDDGATVPFIARYRKEMTGSLDEVAIAAIRDRLKELAALAARREAIIKSLQERNLLSAELEARLHGAETLAALEDIYLPHRPKRRTRATVAREKGLDPLAEKIFRQEDFDVLTEALGFVDPEKGVASAKEALSGARDIISERISEDAAARSQMRNVFMNQGKIRSKVISGKEETGAKYRDYFDWEEPIAAAPSHRVLAMRRGEREEILSLSMMPPEPEALAVLETLFITGAGEASDQVRQAVSDGYKRLLSLSIETEVRLDTKKRADETAIRVFAENLRQLLLAPPLGQRSVLAVDPGFRTGCKLVCLDRQGKLLHFETIQPFGSEAARARAARQVETLCERFGIEAVAVGNGTAGRETERFLRGLALSAAPVVVMVNESGASVYSASDAARREFPDHDITVRGAVSIGRRLMDPLAELVKIDPKSIGVGQYQHDVDQSLLQKALDDVVISCVNAVGVEVNTASVELLSYVSGVGPALAENIVKHREANGPFLSRDALRQVKRFGEKAFEQAAGFLRIRDGVNPLDAGAVHPERYAIVEKMAADQGCSVTDLMADEEKRRRINLSDYLDDSVGLPTLGDIMSELARPGRDPRRQFDPVVFAEGVEKITDLTPGMKMVGIVTNITAFGAFVDVGVHQDGLVHISEMADRFIRTPSEAVKVGQKVDVTVVAVDAARNRIALSMKKNPGQKPDAAGSGKRAGGGARPPIKAKPAKDPFYNPFADALKKK